MSSILTLLAINNAHALNQTVVAGDDGISIQAKLDVLCQSADAENTLVFPPGEITIPAGQMLVYPNPNGGCVASPGNLTIVGNQNQASSIVLGRTVSPQTFLTILPRVDLTVRDIEIRGVKFGDPGTEDITLAELLLDPDNTLFLYADDFLVTQCAGLLAGSPTRAIHIDGRTATAPNQYSMLTIENAEIGCHYATGDGGAVLVEGGGATIIDSKFIGNSSGGSGGAIAVKQGGSAERFSVNPADPSLSVSQDSVFDRNVALFGGAISNTQGGNSSHVRDSYFFSNNGNLGAGAIQFDDQEDVIIERNQFDEQNDDTFDPGQSGGAVAVEMGETLMFKNNIVCGSWAGRGGGLYVDSVFDVDVLNSVFAENGAIEFGGGAFFADSEDQGMDIRVVNNTFAGNNSGNLPDYVSSSVFIDDVIGGGGAASFFGVNPIFQNNVVAYTSSGGGVFGEYVPFTTNGFEIGDPLIIFNNLFYQNTDGQQTAHITGDFTSIASHPSNILDQDPQMVYLGLGEYNCVPEAFYTSLTSPVINNGGNPPAPGSSVPTSCVDRIDTDDPQDFIHDADDGPCDIGAFGGEFALFRKDTDGDGVSNIFDCNDLDDTIAPGQPEVCDFDDNDCDGIVDNDLINQWFPDLDQDGRGAEGGQFILDCANPGGGVVDNDEDCNDTDPTAYYGAPELCDGLDNDCDLAIDNGLEFIRYYPDVDGDTFGAGNFIDACERPGPEYVTVTGDCADDDATRNPNASEPCDGIDNDCDGLVDADDEDVTGAETFYPDRDGDTYGDPTSPERRCSGDPPPNSVTDGGDCDDADASVNPGAQELCALPGDEDCDGQINELDANTGDRIRVYADADGDGIGSGVVYEDLCGDAGFEPPSGFTTTTGDCDDSDAAIGECNQSCGGCSANGGPTGGLLFLAGVLGVVFRRR